MRSSRRRLGLTPEHEPSPTPPNSEGSEFVQDFQIETTIEEEERLRQEDEGNLSSEVEDEQSQDIEETSTIDTTQDKDIVLSSDSSDDMKSEELVLTEKDNLKSSQLNSNIDIFTF